MSLPADSHVHTEWSWDTGGPASPAAGRMRATCAQAVAIGLSTICFTEHLDVPDSWRAGPEDLMPHQQLMLSGVGTVHFAPFDEAGYFDAIDRMRHEFPELHILTGLEFGQPHLYQHTAAQWVDYSRFDRILGSLHTMDLGAGRAEPGTLFRENDVRTVMDAYLEELPRVVTGCDVADVVSHIDYAIRSWPTVEVGPFDPRDYEDGFRAAMRAIAETGRALEMNTRRLWPWIPRWWADEGGAAITLGSDAHTPDAIASNFPEAADMLEHFGFKAGSTPDRFWTR